MASAAQAGHSGAPRAVEGVRTIITPDTNPSPAAEPRIR
jgi:hypothetical protein